MKKSILKFETCVMKSHSNTFRTIIKTQHGRVLFLLLEMSGSDCTILECFYIDRNQGKNGLERYSAKPLKLRTFRCKADDLLSVIEAELDKKFYDVEFIRTAQAEYSMDEYIRFKIESGCKKYNFLIMVGDGEYRDGLPMHLRTRLKNKLHRSVYVELKYYKDGNGVVQQCYYYDRRYRRQELKVTPSQLVSCFFPYSDQGILNLINYEICCDFTHMIVTDHIDLDSNTTPPCGSI